MGDKNSKCEFFKEKYDPTDIYMNWEVVDDPGASDGPSQWAYNTHYKNPT